MDQFVAVAIAHFLALLIPGVDFFLIARTALTAGWRRASGVCLGIAVANGLFIVTAFCGLSLISHPTVLTVIQLAGGAFLIFLGVAFLRSAALLSPTQGPLSARNSWGKNFSLGLASGLLNPKNALFYLSLAAALTGAPPHTLITYGLWMFTVVLAWDVFIAIMLGSNRALARLERLIPWLTKISGGFLMIFGASMIVSIS